jgi:DNA-binding response OmpR family regulator
MRQRPQPPSIPKEDVAGYAVLIFSTERSFLEYYRGMFISMGFITFTATTPEATLAILRLTVVAFVIVDQGSGIFESRGILERTRKTEQNTPVLVITRIPDPNSHREAQALGAAGYLEHPAPPGEILARARRDRHARATISTPILLGAVRTASGG